MCVYAPTNHLIVTQLINVNLGVIVREVSRKQGQFYSTMRDLGNVEMENVFLVATVTGDCMLLAFSEVGVMGAGILNVLQ